MTFSVFSVLACEMIGRRSKNVFFTAAFFMKRTSCEIINFVAEVMFYECKS